MITIRESQINCKLNDLYFKQLLYQKKVIQPGKCQLEINILL